MKDKGNKKRIIFIVLAIVLFIAMGATFAYFNTTDFFDNVFNTGSYGSEATEVFTSPSDWKPGDTTPKTLTVKNTGSTCEHVRVSYTEKWEDTLGNTVANTDANDNPLAIINLDNKADWIKEGNYYYYNKDLAANSSTNSFIKSVTFNPDANLDVSCTSIGNGQRKCSSADSGYDKYTLTIKVETLDCDVSEDAWGVDVTSLFLPTATLDTGQTVNAKWKTLAAGGTSTTYSAQNTTITQIKRAGKLPDAISEAVSTTANKGDSAKTMPLNNSYKVKQLATLGTDYAIISTSNSTIPIYSWYDDGVIYYYSEADVIELNPVSSYLFSNLRSLTNIGNLENEDTSSVVYMIAMFQNAGYNASSFNIDLSSWDTSSVTTMQSTFSNAGYNTTTFNIDLSSWDISSVTNMSWMFQFAGYNATAWNIGDLSSWNTSSVVYMLAMFSSAGRNAATWSIGDLSGWDTSSVTSMVSMFSSAGRNATTWSIGDLSGWDTSSVTSMSGMFNYAGYSATTWSIGNLSGWNTSNVTDMSQMFAYTGYSTTTFDLDLSSWNTSSVTSMYSMFSYAGYNATTWGIGDLSGWNTSSVTTMQDMFQNAGYNVTTFNLDLSSWNISSVTNMSWMFTYAGYNATSWSIGNLSSWNTSSVTDMSGMFQNAGYNATTWQSIGTLKVYATNISYMFYNCRRAKAILNIYSNPTTYTSVFGGAATVSGALITVNYASTTTNIDNIIATKSSNSNVVKGSVIS